MSHFQFNINKSLLFYIKIMIKIIEKAEISKKTIKKTPQRLNKKHHENNRKSTTKMIKETA